METIHLIDIHPLGDCDNGCGHCPFNGYDSVSREIDQRLIDTFSAIQNLLIARNEYFDLGWVTTLGGNKKPITFAIPAASLSFISRLIFTFGTISPEHTANIEATIQQVEKKLINVLQNLFDDYSMKNISIDLYFSPKSTVLNNEERIFMNRFLERYINFIGERSFQWGILGINCDTVPLSKMGDAAMKESLDNEYSSLKDCLPDKIQIIIDNPPKYQPGLRKYTMIGMNALGYKAGISKRLVAANNSYGTENTLNVATSLLEDLRLGRSKSGKISFYSHGGILFHGASTVHNEFLQVSYERIIAKVNEAILQGKGFAWVCDELLNENIQNYYLNGEKHSEEQLALLPKNIHRT